MPSTSRPVKGLPTPSPDQSIRICAGAGGTPGMGACAKHSAESKGAKGGSLGRRGAPQLNIQCQERPRKGWHDRASMKARGPGQDLGSVP